MKLSKNLLNLVLVPIYYFPNILNPLLEFLLTGILNSSLGFSLAGIAAIATLKRGAFERMLLSSAELAPF